MQEKIVIGLIIFVAIIVIFEVARAWVAKRDAARTKGTNPGEE